MVVVVVVVVVVAVRQPVAQPVAAMLANDCHRLHQKIPRAVELQNVELTLWA